MSAEVEGISGEEVEFLMVLRKIEEMWRQGFKGRITLHCGEDGQLKLEHTAFWKPGDG